MADRITWFRHQFKGEGTRLRNAGLLALITALAAMALLGLSGWFISAAALAGLAAGGPAVAFNLLVPSAGIRALALGRTVARYLERLVSHEATFRVMHRLRTTLFAAILPRVPGPLSRFSGGQLLERLLGDVERLENAWLGQGQPLLTAAAPGLLLLGLCAAVAGPAAQQPRFSRRSRVETWGDDKLPVIDAIAEADADGDADSVAAASHSR